MHIWWTKNIYIQLTEIWGTVRHWMRSTEAQVPQEFKASIRGATASWIRGSLRSPFHGFHGWLELGCRKGCQNGSGSASQWHYQNCQRQPQLPWATPAVIELIERIEPTAICKICKVYLHWTWYEGWPWSSRWALLTCQPVRSSQFVDWRHRTSVPTRGLSSPTAAVFSCRSIHQAVHWLMITFRTWSFGGCGILHFQTDPYKK